MILYQLRVPLSFFFFPLDENLISGCGFLLWETNTTFEMFSWTVSQWLIPGFLMAHPIRTTSPRTCLCWRILLRSAQLMALVLAFGSDCCSYFKDTDSTTVSRTISFSMLVVTTCGPQAHCYLGRPSYRNSNMKILPLLRWLSCGQSLATWPRSGSMEARDQLAPVLLLC